MRSAGGHERPPGGGQCRRARLCGIGRTGGGEDPAPRSRIVTNGQRMSGLGRPIRRHSGRRTRAICARERCGLTVCYPFDSYLTMYVERGRQGRLAPGQFERIAKALSDPRRFALLEAIASSAQCPYHQLCEDFPVTKATISHHLKELVQAGLVDAERAGQFVNTRVRRDVMRAYAAELLRRVGSERNRTD